MKLKYIFRFGSFYEYEGKLGWMPFYKVWIVKAISDAPIKWIPHSQIRFV